MFPPLKFLCGCLGYFLVINLIAQPPDHRAGPLDDLPGHLSPVFSGVQDQHPSRGSRSTLLKGQTQAAPFSGGTAAPSAMRANWSELSFSWAIVRRPVALRPSSSSKKLPFSPTTNLARTSRMVF